MTAIQLVNVGEFSEGMGRVICAGIALNPRDPKTIIGLNVVGSNNSVNQLKAILAEESLTPLSWQSKNGFVKKRDVQSGGGLKYFVAPIPDTPSVSMLAIHHTLTIMPSKVPRPVTDDYIFLWGGENWKDHMALRLKNMLTIPIEDAWVEAIFEEATLPYHVEDRLCGRIPERNEKNWDIHNGSWFSCGMNIIWMENNAEKWTALVSRCLRKGVIKIG